MSDRPDIWARFEGSGWVWFFGLGGVRAVRPNKWGRVGGPVVDALITRDCKEKITTPKSLFIRRKG